MTKAEKIFKSKKYDNLTLPEFVGVMQYLFTHTSKYLKDSERVGTLLVNKYKHMVNDMHLVFNSLNKSGDDRSILMNCKHMSVYDDILVEVKEYEKIKIQYECQIKYYYAFFCSDEFLIKFLLSQKIIREMGTSSYHVYAINETFVNRFITDRTTINTNINTLSSAILNINRISKINNIISSRSPNKNKQFNKALNKAVIK